MMPLYPQLSAVIIVEVCAQSPIGLIACGMRPPVGRTAAVFGVGFLVVFVAAQSVFTLYSIAILAPFSLMLPALAMRRLTRQYVDWKPFSAADSGLALLLLVGLYCSALGVFDFDLYRFGFQPLGAGAVALSGGAIWLVAGQSVLVCGVRGGPCSVAFGRGKQQYVRLCQ